MHIYCPFGSHIYSLSSMTTYVLLVWQAHISFSLLMPINATADTCLPINTNGHEVLGDSNNYVTFVSHTFSITCMIP